MKKMRLILCMIFPGLLFVVMGVSCSDSPVISNALLSATPPPDETPTTTTVCNNGQEPDALTMMGYFVFDFADPNADIIALDIKLQIENSTTTTTLNFPLLFQKSGRTAFLYSHEGYPTGTTGKMTWNAVDSQGNKSSSVTVAFQTGNEANCSTLEKENQEIDVSPESRFSIGIWND